MSVCSARVFRDHLSDVSGGTSRVLNLPDFPFKRINSDPFLLLPNFVQELAVQPLLFDLFFQLCIFYNLLFFHTLASNTKIGFVSISIYNIIIQLSIAFFFC